MKRTYHRGNSGAYAQCPRDVAAGGQGNRHPAQLHRATVTPAQAVKGMTSSCEALHALIETSLNSDGRIRNSRPDVAGFIGYPIAHDAHHRGQVTRLARQHPLPQRAMFGMWEWG